MPSVRYYNQSAPFWDFIANLEDQGFANRGATNEGENNEQPNPWNHPWAQQGWTGFPFAFGGPFAHRGRHGPPGPPPAADPPESTPPPFNDEKEGEAGPSEPRGPPPPFAESGPPPTSGPGAHRGRCGGRGRGGWGARGRSGHHHGGPFAHGMGGFGALAQMFQDQLFNNGTENNTKDKADDFRPEADVFDTAEAFVIHVSLPGAKKEDLGVHWDAEKSELSIAGVVHRPGDEEFLRTLAMDERKVGAFERKVRLGSRANPAQVDVEGIAARLEEGVLRVEVPKLDAGYVEIKKVDVE